MNQQQMLAQGKLHETGDLQHYAATAAAKVLAPNWEAAIADGVHPSMIMLDLLEVTNILGEWANAVYTALPAAVRLKEGGTKVRDPLKGLSGADEIFIMAQAMRQFGGGFVKQLGELFAQADHANQEKLLEAFPEYVEEYLAIGHQKLPPEDLGRIEEGIGPDGLIHGRWIPPSPKDQEGGGR